jgi:hypothetical protein
MKKLLLPATVLLMLACVSSQHVQAIPAQPYSTPHPAYTKAKSRPQATRKTHADWHPQVRGRIFTRALRAPAKTKRAKERRMAGFSAAETTQPGN